jgi:hypothetical protein
MAEQLEGVPYQAQPQVHQLLGERANADALGLTDRVAAVDKQLGSLGYSRAAAERVKAAEDDDDAKTAAPKARTTRQQQSTEQKK